MAGPIITTPSTEPIERRRVERRGNSRIGDLTLPEVRRIFITLALGAIVLALFFWMVKSVIVAAILGLIIGFYLRPLHLRLMELRRGATELVPAAGIDNEQAAIAIFDHVRWVKVGRLAHGERR